MYKVVGCYLDEISQLMHLTISAKLHMVKITHQTERKAVLKKTLYEVEKASKIFFINSVCNFQSIKSPMELNSLLSKFFCYVAWFDKRRNWRPYKRGLFFKSYCFFEIIS